MGFLDKKERILDIVLTGKGREFFSKNNLNFSYYAFSDDQFDYSGSFSASLALSVSFDSYVHKSLMLEAATYNDSISNFLYSIDDAKIVLPEMVSNIDDQIMHSLYRHFYVENDYFDVQGLSIPENVQQILMRVSLARESRDDQEKKYALEQHIEVTKDKFVRNESIIGRHITEEHIVISDTKVLNITNGQIENFIDVFGNSAQNVILNEHNDVELITGIDSQKIEFALKDYNGYIRLPSGFLVEIYESSSDGKLVKLTREDIIDELNDDIFQKGFENYLDIEVDVGVINRDFTGSLGFKQYIEFDNPFYSQENKLSNNSYDTSFSPAYSLIGSFPQKVAPPIIYTATGAGHYIAVFSGSLSVTGSSNFTFDLTAKTLVIKSGTTDTSIKLFGGAVTIQERTSPPFVAPGSGFGSLHASSPGGHLYYRDSGGANHDLSRKEPKIGLTYGLASHPIYKNNDITNATIANYRFELVQLRTLECSITASQSRFYLHSALAGGQTASLTAAFYTFDEESYTFTVVSNSLHHFDLDDSTPQHYAYTPVDFVLSEGERYFYGFQVSQINVVSVAVMQFTAGRQPSYYLYSGSYFTSSHIDDLTKTIVTGSTYSTLILSVMSSGGYVLFGP